MTVQGTLKLANGTAPTANQTDAQALTAAQAMDHTSGSVGGLTLASDKMYIGTGTYGNANTPFYVDSGGDFSLKDKLTWDQSAGTLSITGAVTATSGSFTGSLTSTSGTIGGFTMGSNVLYAGADGTRVSLSTADGIHLGHNTFGSAPFRVTRAGALTASSATITGGITATSGSIADGVTVGSGSVVASTVVSGAATGTTVGGYFSSGVLGRAAGGFGISTDGSEGVPYLNGGWNFEDELAIGRGGTGASASTTWLNANVHSYAVQGGTSTTWTRFASGKVDPTSATHTFTVVWKDGAGAGVGSSPHTTVIRANFDSTNNDINTFTTVSNAASATVGSTQNADTTAAYIDVTSGNTTCRLTANYVSITSFNFKFS